MATQRANGEPILTLVRDGRAEGLTNMKLTVHANGHILAKRPGPGWRVWAIVPIDALGSVVNWLKEHRSFTEAPGKR